MGQYAVAFVTLNRAGYNKDRVCAEVFKPKQFSWANKGVVKRGSGWALASYLHPHDEYAWWVAQKIANNALAGHIQDTTNGALFYHAKNVSPYWKAAMTPVKKVGNHLFYTLPV